MRSFVLQAATFLIMATAAFSQSLAAAVSSSESQSDEQQIRQIEAEMLKGEMNSDPAIFEKILADDCVNWPAGPGLTKARLVDWNSQGSGASAPLYRKR